jgi:hypothetical protein
MIQLNAINTSKNALPSVCIMHRMLKLLCVTFIFIQNEWNEWKKSPCKYSINSTTTVIKINRIEYYYFSPGVLCKGKVEWIIINIGSDAGSDDVIYFWFIVIDFLFFKKKLRKQKEKLIFRGVQFIKQDKCEEKSLIDINEKFIESKWNWTLQMKWCESRSRQRLSWGFS